MNKLGDIYIAELADNKIDKASLRWMLLNQKNIPISSALLSPITSTFPFDVFLMDEIDLLKKTSTLQCYDKENESDDLQDIASHLKLGYLGKGKPYFTDININFSISHTSNREDIELKPHTNISKKTIWGCAFSDCEIGLDLQFVRQVKYGEIAEKYFSELENEFIRKYGINGFFQVWTRREAIGKAVAEGFFINDSDFKGSVGENFELLQEIEYQGKNLELFTHRFAENLWCSCCIVKMG